MRIKGVLILEEAMVDLEDGKCFYDKKESGVGDYFWDSLFADFESLVIYAGIHSKRFGFQRMLAVKPRNIIDTLFEQLELFLGPVFHRLKGRNVAQCFLRDVLIVDLNVAFDGVGQVLGGVEAGGG